MSDESTPPTEHVAVLDLFKRFIEDMERTLPAANAKPVQFALLLRIMIDVAARTAAAFNIPLPVFLTICAESMADATGDVVVIETLPQSRTSALTDEQKAELLRHMKAGGHVH